MMGYGIWSQIVSSIFVLVTAWYGLTFNPTTQEAINNVITKLGQVWERETPKNFTPRDVGDYRNEFIFDDNKTINFYGALANITNFKEKNHCKKYEEMTKEDLYELIEIIGNKSHLDPMEVKKMKVSIRGARAFEATEQYEFGRNGHYLLLKYSAAKTASGNYDFLIAHHGFTWELDVLTDEEREEMLEEKLGNIKGVLVEDLPDVGKTDILNWFRVQTKERRTLGEIDAELERFRARSEKSLSHFCKALTTKGQK